MADQPTERLVVGLVRGIHGLRGAVRVELLTDDPSRFAVGAVVHPEGRPESLTVAWVQEDGPGMLIRFREVTDRSGAEALRDRYFEVEVPGDVLPAGESIVWSLAKEALESTRRSGRFTVFSLVDALTRISGRMKFAGERADADAKASSLLALAV